MRCWLHAAAAAALAGWLIGWLACQQRQQAGSQAGAPSVACDAASNLSEQQTQQAVGWLSRLSPPPAPHLVAVQGAPQAAAAICFHRGAGTHGPPADAADGLQACPPARLHLLAFKAAEPCRARQRRRRRTLAAHVTSAAAAQHRRHWRCSGCSQGSRGGPPSSRAGTGRHSVCHECGGSGGGGAAPSRRALAAVPAGAQRSRL